VARLAAGSSSTLPMLYALILAHLNRGRRGNRLVDPCMTDLQPEGSEEGEAEAAGEAAGE
jgi:hypothetical protein